MHIKPCFTCHISDFSSLSQFILYLSYYKLEPRNVQDVILNFFTSFAGLENERSIAEGILLLQNSTKRVELFQIKHFFFKRDNLIKYHLLNYVNTSQSFGYKQFTFTKSGTLTWTMT